MSLEQGITELVAALSRNSDLLERVVAGQEAAMAKLEGGTKAPRTPRKAKEDAPATGAGEPTGGSGEAAGTASGAESAGNASEAAAPSPVNVATIAATLTDADKMKEYVGGFTGATEDAEERARRVQLLKDIAGKCGVEPGFSKIVPHAKTVVFYIERAKLGKPVDFSVAYDLDGDPGQDAAAPAASSDDDFG